MKQHCLKLLGFLSCRKSDFVVIHDILWWILSIDYKNSFQYAPCSEIYKQRKKNGPSKLCKHEDIGEVNFIMHNKDK